MKKMIKSIMTQVELLASKVESGESSKDDRINLAVLTNTLNNLKYNGNYLTHMPQTN